MSAAHLRKLWAVAVVLATACGTPSTDSVSKLASPSEVNLRANPDAPAGVMEGGKLSLSTSVTSSGTSIAMPHVIRGAHGGAIFDDVTYTVPTKEREPNVAGSDASLEPQGGPSSGGNTAPGSTSPPPSSGNPTPGPPEPTAAPTTPAPTPASGPKCPNPKTCDIYQPTEGANAKGWRPNTNGCSGGSVCIRYSINATAPQGGSITAKEIEDAIQAAVEVWASASPKLEFVYLGTTTREPRQGDGHTDFALGNNVLWVNDYQGYVTEADVLRAPLDQGKAWIWDPCAQRDDSCVPSGGKGIRDIQHTMTHELGHVLGLADLAEDGSNLLTMRMGGEEPSAGLRHRATLGLGDALGIRHLYPCDCPLPPIYAP